MIFQYIRFLSLILISLIVLVGCGGGATPTPPPATSTPEATPTSEPATPTSEPPTATPVPEDTTESVTFEFVKELSTLEELEDIGFSLDTVEGIDGSSGSEVSITIRYDPEVITVEELRTTMAQIGYAVKE